MKIWNTNNGGNFSGEVAIIFDSKLGNDASYSNGRLQFTIPDSGILLTKASFKSGKEDDRFFIQNDKGSYDTLTTSSFHDNSKKKYVFFDRIITFYKNINGKEKKRFVEMFYVGEKMDSVSNKNRFFFEQHINDLIQNEN